MEIALVSEGRRSRGREDALAHRCRNRSANQVHLADELNPFFHLLVDRIHQMEHVAGV